MLLSTKSEVRFSGTRSSEEYNRWAETVVKDLYQLYDIVNKGHAELPRRYMALLRENLLLQHKLVQLEGMLSTLYEDRPTLHHSFSDSTGVIFPENPAHVDTGFGIAHGAVRSQVSKVYLVDTNGTPRLPEEAAVRVYVSEEPFSAPSGTTVDFGRAELLEDNTAQARQMIDGLPTTFWHADVERKDINELYVAIHVQLPAVFAHLLTNTITLRPLPVFSMELTDVWLRGAGSWFRPSTAPGKPVTQLRDMRLIFSEADVLECIVYLRQPIWFNRDGMRVFPIGMKHLGLELMRFHKNSVLRVPFSLPDDNVSYEEIRGVTIHYAPYSPQGDQQLVSVRLLDEFGQTLELYEQPQALTRTVFVELTFHSHDISPLVEAISLEYEYA